MPPTRCSSAGSCLSPSPGFRALGFQHPGFPIGLPRTICTNCSRVAMDPAQDLYFRQIQIGPMANFVYLVGSRAAGEAVVVDPAWSVGELVKVAEADGMKLTAALVTHYHPDHVGGNFRGHSIEGL